MGAKTLALIGLLFSFFLQLPSATAAVTVPIDQTLGANEASSTTVNSDAIEITDGPFAIRVRGIGADGSSSSSGDKNGASMGSIGTFQNKSGADLTVGQTAPFSNSVFGINLKIQGGNGASGTSGDGGDVGSIGSDKAVNAASIHILPGTYEEGVALWRSLLMGGNGGDGDRGGHGGATGDITVSNTGSLQIGTSDERASVNNFVEGIVATASAGNAGEGSTSDGEGVGAPDSGNVSVSTSNSIQIYAEGDPITKIFGILASTSGGNGAPSHTKGTKGGHGGHAGTNTVILNQGGDILVDVTEPGEVSTGGGLVIGSSGGHGGRSYEETTGGRGGDAGGATLSITDATVVTRGSSSKPAVSIRNSGGSGGDGDGNKNASDAGRGGDALDSSIAVRSLTEGFPTGFSTSENNSNALQVFLRGGTGGFGKEFDNSFLGVGYAGDGGSGGIAGDVDIDFENEADSVGIVTSGSYSRGVFASTVGGAGGSGGEIKGNSGISSVGSKGGDGGSGGEISITSTGANGLSLETGGEEAHGIVAVSQGGEGGAAGKIKSGTTNNGKKGGRGGSGGDIEVDLGADTAIAVSGDQAIGVGVQSLGSDGGKGGDIDDILGAKAGDGGTGGDSGAVTVTLASGSDIETAGEDSYGIAARSLSGGGGEGGAFTNAGVAGEGGNAGDGGDTGEVTVRSDGTVHTGGDGSHGIIAQALTGAGGDAGDAKSIFYSGGGTGGKAGTLAKIEVDLSATSSIATEGNSAHGVVAQSIAGGGGTAGEGLSLVSLGGSSKSGGDGGEAVLKIGGNITTTGDSSLGVLAQSIAGGGGDGGNSTGIVSVGSDGASGGAGGTVSVSFDTAGPGNQIATGGQLSHAVVAQSIGGGGGNAGNAKAFGVEGSVAIGGKGGAGGTGGDVIVSGSDTIAITTADSNSHGIVAQSIGGGGGSGGSAFTLSAGVGFDSSVSVGGDGGSGGETGSVNIDLGNATIRTGTSASLFADPSNQNPTDAFGIVAQSIAGGGGIGGSATAKALAVAVPVPDTDTAFGVSAAFAVGGSGGIGGDANEVNLFLADGSSVATQGQGSHAIIAQSIGGGGGLGGDSSASASTVGFSAAAENTVELSVGATLGGDGGGAGDGDDVTVGIGRDADGNTGRAAVTTFGDYANAIIAQSIGGGGGNAGIGSGNTKERGATVSVDATIDLGATGGSGGAGGEVVVTVAPQGSLNTFGSGSHGIVAQSIGGGGGTSQGGSLSFGADATFSGGGEEGDEGEAGEKLELTGKVNIGLGKDGGSGSSGGAVFVQNDGSITTRGGDAYGIFAQSVGGGGGLAGGAGSDASADNSIDPNTRERRFGLFTAKVGGEEDDKTSLSATLDVSLGGGGGEAANGGNVTVEHNGSIRTTGDWSKGVVAQSIGGGGGKAGTAVAQDTDTTPDLRLQLAVNGDGGEAGNGGSVDLAFFEGSTISTSGFGAFGVFGQSVGGGGGIAIDGSDSAAGVENFGSFSPGTINVGGRSDGNGGNGGDGGAVSFAGVLDVRTQGVVAHGVVLQSIAGGGGLGGHGSSVGFGVGSFDKLMNLTVGGGNGSSGSGGAVSINQSVLSISTEGLGSFGVLAQSIGGGGGLAISQIVGSNGGAREVGGKGSSGDGGMVDLTFSEGSSIFTTGLAAHAILAQSIGGGGGIAGTPSRTPTIQGTKVAARNPASSGDGGNVTINFDGTITTTGDGAHGIFAQSIGGGGGIIGQADDVRVGSAGGDGTGGSIRITQNGSIRTLGENSIGIFAQQAGGSSDTDANVRININGDVTGGSGEQGYGAWIITQSQSDSELNIGPAGRLSALSGNALRFDSKGPGRLNVTNRGTIVGNVDSSGTSGGPGIQIRNAPSGQIFAGSRIDAHVRNEGRFFVGHGIPGSSGQTVVTGDFNQVSGGALIFRTDFERGQTDSLKIEGDATLDGEVSVQPVPGSRIVPNRRLTLVTVDGTITGGLRLGRIPGIFDYSFGRSGNSFSIAAVGINLTSVLPNLERNQFQVAEHLEAYWLSGNSGLDIFGTLDAIARSNPGSLRLFFNEMTPGSTLGFGARGSTEGQSFSDAVLNGPIFEGDSTRLAENPSVWVRTHGRTTSQHFDDSFLNYDIDSLMYQVGGQAAVGETTYLGGSIAYRDDSLSSENNVSSGNGDTALGAVTLKHEEGDWLFAGALSGSLGWYETSRRISFPGEEGVAEGSPRVQTGALALRAAYTEAFKKFYLRPMVTLTGVYTNASAYTETGAGGFALAVDSADQSTLFFTPAFEVGARSDFENGWIARTFVRPALDLSTSDSWEQEARFVGAPDSAGGFTTELPLDEVSGMITAGFDLQFNESFSAHLRYEGKFSENVSTNGGSIGLKLSF